jgi:hypothetical protein
MTEQTTPAPPQMRTVRFCVDVSVTDAMPEDPDIAADEFHDAIGLAPFPEWVFSIDFAEMNRE